MSDRSINEVITDLAEDLKDLVDFGADIAVDAAESAISWVERQSVKSSPAKSIIDAILKAGFK